VTKLLQWKSLKIMSTLKIVAQSMVALTRVSSQVYTLVHGILCYKKNMFVGTDPTYPVVKPVTASLIAWHEAETTCTSDGPSPEAVMKGKKER